MLEFATLFSEWVGILFLIMFICILVADKLLPADENFRLVLSAILGIVVIVTTIIGVYLL